MAAAGQAGSLSSRFLGQWRRVEMPLIIVHSGLVRPSSLSPSPPSLTLSLSLFFWLGFRFSFKFSRQPSGKRQALKQQQLICGKNIWIKYKARKVKCNVKATTATSRLNWKFGLALVYPFLSVHRHINKPKQCFKKGKKKDLLIYIYLVKQSESRQNMKNGIRIIISIYVVWIQF